MELQDLLRVARGEAPADLLIKNARVVNVFTGEILETHVAIVGGRIAGLGDYEAKAVEDLQETYLCPGFIDAHVHIESSMVPPDEYARVVVPRGTTTVVCDPHEIANVLGLAGIRFMIDNARDLPLDVRVMAPSCVPATDMETSGARLLAKDLATLLSDPKVLGLAEVMNFPGVVHGAPDVLDKLRVFRDRVKDGHAPRLTGKQLCAYVAAEILSDHECTTVVEAREKLRLGMWVFIREGTFARNLHELIKVVDDNTDRRICLCTDDRSPTDLMDEGHIDHMIRVAIGQGMEPVRAIALATFNPSEYFGLKDRGAIVPGRRADLVAFSRLDAPRADTVWSEGRVVARSGYPSNWPRRPRAGDVPRKMNVAWDKVSLRIEGDGRRTRVIGVVPDQLITRHIVEDLPSVGGAVQAAPDRDILKMAVIERHEGTGRTGLGFLQGFGLRRGAIASTVAHDHHNLVIAGADDASMMTAAKAVAATGGGKAVALGDKVLALTPLPIAGLMSDQPFEAVRRQMDACHEAARGLGSTLRDPFIALSFMALPVIPSLKLTDHGLVDVEKFQLVPLTAS